MSPDPLDYPLLLQQSLRLLVRRCLEIVSEQGLPGDHHFYLSFRTDAPGVDMPPHLRERYPEEMTIVLKTRFRDLEVDDDAFSVGLFFSGVLNHLTIPFASLTSFTDPAAEFQLVFQPAQEPEEEAPEPSPEAEEGEPPAGDDGDGAGGKVVSISGFRKRDRT